MLVGFDVSTLMPHTLRGPPWKTKPELSGKNAGSYCVAIETTALRWRSWMYEPETLATPCPTKRPSGELRVQYDDTYVTSFSTRIAPWPATSHSGLRAKSARHAFASVAVPQPNIGIMLL